MDISVARARWGALVLLACVQYPIAELATASAWRTPAYSFTDNFISDLGVTSCTTTVCSPWAFVMNGAFVASGVLAVAAAALLSPLLPGVYRYLLLGLASVHGLGVILVGLVHSAPHTAAGTPAAHLAGAYCAILGGNFALLAAGIGIRRGMGPPWLAFAFCALGALGLCGGLALLTVSFIPPGLLERIAADTITPSELLTGFALLRGLGRLPAGQARVPLPALRRST